MPENNSQITEQEREIILERLEASSPELIFSSGSSSTSFTRDEMLDHIKAKDDIGNDFVETELEFIRAFKSGDLMKRLATL